MDATREQLARQDGRASRAASLAGVVLLLLGGALWVGAAAGSQADLAGAAVGQMPVLLSLVLHLASVAYGISARWWRYGGGGHAGGTVERDPRA